MIKFHKISSPPKNVTVGEEHIWFADYGAIYVSDNKGKPRLITAGTQTGDNIPTGKPKEPNILYYCKNNKKNYISGLDKWIEIPTKSIPGTGGGAGTAGTVLVEDLQDWYTSVDVEGVLNEIGTAFPHFFGKRLLVDFADDTKKINYPSELHLAPTATNLPEKGLHGWQNTRVASDKNSYGTFIGHDGSAFTVVNQKYVKLAGNKELVALKEVVDKDLAKLSSSKIQVGEGLKTNNKTLAQGVKIDVDYAKLAEKHNHDKLYVKKDGDTMTGKLRINSKAGDSSLQLQNNNNNHKVSFYVNPTTNNSGLYDNTNGTGILRYNFKTGRTSIYAYHRLKSGEDSELSGRFDVHADKQIHLNAEEEGANNTDGAVRIQSSKTSRTLRLQNFNGGLTLGAADSRNFINSTGTGTESSRSLTISGGDAGPIPDIKVSAEVANFTNDVAVGHGLRVGMDPNTGRGTSTLGSKIYLYPFESNGGKGEDHYTHIGYSQSTQTLHLRSYLEGAKTTGGPSGTIKIGSEIVITRPVDYYNTHLSVGGIYKVMEISGNRVVVGRGGVVTAAMHISNIKLEKDQTSSSTSSSVPLTVKATKFTSTSSIKYKNVIGKYEKNALDVVNDADIYQYTFKNDPSRNKSIGLIIEKGAPKEIVVDDAIDSYAMTSFLWKAVQELSQEVKELKDKLK